MVATAADATLALEAIPWSLRPGPLSTTSTIDLAKLCQLRMVCEGADTPVRGGTVVVDRSVRSRLQGTGCEQTVSSRVQDS